MNGWIHALPEIFLLVATLTVLVLDLFLRDQSRLLSYLLTQLALFATIIVVYGDFGGEPIEVLNDLFVHDYLGSTLKIVALALTMLALVYSRHYWREHKIWQGEYYVLALFAVLGTMIIISGNHLLVLYLGLELMSLSLYTMVALQRDDSRATEAAMKYFVLGAIASGLLLYGISLLYGLSGAMDLNSIASYAATNVAEGSMMQNLPLLFALVFLVAGVAFKLGAAPFHMWVPDVYQGAPTAVTLFIASVPKIAAFALLFRLMINGLEQTAPAWGQMIMLIGILSVVLGNILAIAQHNLKRMFAYSTIAHMGFILLAVMTRSQDGLSAGMFYAIVYTFMAAGGFAVLILLSRGGLDAETLSDLKGLNKRSPWFAFVMLLLLFSMAGIPPLAGFYAKLTVISAVMKASHVWVALLMVLMSVVGAFYYLRAIKVMYFDEPEDVTPVKAGLDFSVVLSLNGVGILLLGLFPGLLMSVCMAALGTFWISGS